MTRSEAEHHAQRIKAVLGKHWFDADSAHYGLIVIVEKGGSFQVAYRNAEDLWWDLTNADAQRAAAAIRRWDSPGYRRLRPNFDALLNVSDYAWEDPQMDSVRMTSEPKGALRIEEHAANDFRLLWFPASAGEPVDLSDLSVEDAIVTAFGLEALEYHRQLYI